MNPRLSFHKRIFAWFAVALAILTIVGYTVNRSLAQLDAEKAWVDHTYIVIGDIKEILSNLKDIQSAPRGYVITGQEDYLVPYSIALPKIPALFSDLEEKVKDNPEQKKNLDILKAKAEQRILTAQDVIEIYNKKGQTAAMDLVKKGTGKREMDEIRVIVNDMVNEEVRLLGMRQSRLEQTSILTSRISKSGILICVMILGIVFTLINRESHKRETTEESLKEALERTEQVTIQNALIGKLSDYMQSCQSTEEAFQVIGNSLPRLLPGGSGTISIFRNSRNTVEVMTAWGDDALCEQKDFHPDQCWALRRGRAHYYVPGGTEPCCAHFAGQPTGASLCLPMQAHGETLGLFAVTVRHIEDTNKEKVAFCRRVSEQVSLAIANLNLQHKLREQSIRDPLTRLFNRRYLESTLDREISRSQRNKDPLSVLVLDIDHFKKFNDTLGHDAGDALLAQFAAMLEQNVRKEDVVCRYGGEEFVVVLPMASLDMAVERGRKICEATRKLKIKSPNQEITNVTVSIGVSTFPANGASPHDLITEADEALYRAKHNGRNQVVAATPGTAMPV